ncbi:MAG: hypothetical protein WAP55_03400 [Minisyncoccia bacterium]
MADQSAAPSLGKIRVVAYVKNGAVWSILATPRGLRSCLNKHKDDPRHHNRMPNLQEFAQMIRAVEVLLPEDPNTDHPTLERCIGIEEFVVSGENYRDTGAGTVDHQRAGQARSVAVI